MLWNKLPPILRVNLESLSVNEFKNAIALLLKHFLQLSLSALILFKVISSI